MMNPQTGTMRRELPDKHFPQKHGPGVYYGQK